MVRGGMASWRRSRDDGGEGAGGDGDREGGWRGWRDGGAEDRKDDDKRMVAMEEVEGEGSGDGDGVWRGVARGGAHCNLRSKSIRGQSAHDTEYQNLSRLQIAKIRPRLIYPCY